MSAPISPRRSCNNTNNTSEYVSENQRIGLRLIYDLLFVYCQVICAKGESWLNSLMSFFFLCYPMKILFMHIHKQFEQFFICFVHRSFICYNCSHVFLRTALCALPSNWFVKQTYVPRAKVIPRVSRRRSVDVSFLSSYGGRFSTSVIITRLHLRNKRLNIYGRHSSRTRLLPVNPLIRKSCASCRAPPNHLSMPAAFSWRDTCAPSLIEIEIGLIIARVDHQWSVYRIIRDKSRNFFWESQFGKSILKIIKN